MSSNSYFCLVVSFTVRFVMSHFEFDNKSVITLSIFNIFRVSVSF